MTISALADPSFAHFWDDKKTKGKYWYPLRPDAKTSPHLWMDVVAEVVPIGWFMTVRGGPTHQGPFLHAIDFLVLDGNFVLAARTGRVTQIVEHNTVWGDGEEFSDKLNYVTILHGDGEYSQCCHLAQNSVSAIGVSVGDIVVRGQIIGRVGKTGWTDRDHLHFIVFILEDNPFGFKSLIPQWEADQ